MAVSGDGRRSWSASARSCDVPAPRHACYAFPMTVRGDLSPEDLKRASARGLSEQEIYRQLEILTAPPPAITLDRPCTIGDGITRIDDGAVPELLQAHASAVAAGRATCFVPASGAASRMFKSLLAVRARGPVDRSTLASSSNTDDRTALRFFDRVGDFAFANDLAETLRRRKTELDECRRRGAVTPVLDGVLSTDGLALADQPKGLLPFHRYPNGARAAFDEHLVESSALARAGDGATRLHFTVSPSHALAFAAHLESVRAPLEARLEARFEVGFSTQKGSTDTVAVDAHGQAFRDDEGALLFRPGGHGSLIANLADLAQAGADIVFVKNIDNVVHDDWRAPAVHWRRLLAGSLITLQRRFFSALRALDEAPDRRAAADDAVRVIRNDLGIVVDTSDDDVDTRIHAARRVLDRPTRVCAVLQAEGDPGGGPFWVAAPDGSVSLQIVETAQVDASSAEQRAIQARATHFSPADMVLGVRDYQGDAFDLDRHVDPEAVFIAEKSSGGRALRALEHPGLWNGGMSDWNTLFVEVPPSIFHPVKALTDLLAPAHQPIPEPD